jgi:uncharacterized phage protein gp47/JayE
MPNTAVPDIVFTPQGVVIPQEADILAGVQADQQTAFGGGLNPSLETPQGQLASSLAAIIAAKNDKLAQLVNQVDPDTADGRFQDAIARIYFLDRLPATSTTVAVLCTGLAGVVIPVGARVQASDGTIYAATGGGTIPVGGSVTLAFAAQTTGPIACATGMITTIYQAIPGWDTVTNVAPGVVGSDVESRADFEFRRKQSVALNARGSLPSIYANVFDVANVTDVYAAENVTDSPVTIGTITMVPHSIYVAAVGGLAQDIANAIWRQKSCGADYNGNTTVSVTDNSGYSPPLPTYSVKFQIPPAVPVKFAVSIANTPGLPSTIIADVQAAIISAFNGGDGGPRARIGSTIYASRYYAPVSNIRSGYVEILSLKLGTATPTLDAVTIDIAKVPTLAASDIAVTLV